MKAKYDGVNYSLEIMDAIYYYNNGDKNIQNYIDILYYLYYNTIDKTLKEKIVNVFNKYNYCIQCGSKMIKYTWEEPHTELNPTEYEEMSCYDCPVCGDFHKK